MFGQAATATITADQALPGRDVPVPVADRHAVLDVPMTGPWPNGYEVIYVAMGCFWGAERIFWELPGVYTTAAGYMGGWTANPSYEETCTARTGHAEAAMVVYDPARITLDQLFTAFWENHDPTTLNRQGNDIGPQYRSAIFTTSDAQQAAAEASRDRYQAQLAQAGYGQISTHIARDTDAGDGQFYYAENPHQQYLHKNPGGYCNHGFCQVSYDATAG